jgi:hypothetical protein
MPAPPLLAPSELPRARSPELPDPLDPDAPERDCSLLVDSRDWAIDHSFFQNRERPDGRPPERSSSLVQHGRASRRRKGLLRPISHKPCPSIARSDFLFTRSVCTRRSHPVGVYVPSWHAMCMTSHRAGGNHYALAVVAHIRGVQVFPFPPLALVPNRDPGCHPGRGLTLSTLLAARCRLVLPEISPLRLVFRRGRDRTAPATVHG